MIKRVRGAKRRRAAEKPIRPISYAYRIQRTRMLAMTVMIVITALQVIAQSGEDGLTAAYDEVAGYFDLGTDLMYAVGALLGLVGATKVFQKWNAGDQDTGKVAAAWFGSCIFLIVVATVLRGFFGV